jgi:hypothetical protein
MQDRKEDRKGKLIELVRQAAPSDRPPAVRITGHHNIVGHGNIVIHAPVIRRRNVIDPRASELTEAQKLELRRLIKDWIAAHNTASARAKPLTWAAAWSCFQRKFCVTSYHLLPAGRFDEACAWLRSRRARIDRLQTPARRKPAWLDRQIVFIKAS